MLKQLFDAELFIKRLQSFSEIMPQHFSGEYKGQLTITNKVVFRRSLVGKLTIDGKRAS